MNRPTIRLFPSTSNPSLGLSFASRSLPFGSTGLCCRPIRMITCRGLNMAKHLIVELEAVLLEKGKSSKDLVRATGHTTVNVSRIRQAKMRGIRMDTLMEICLELDCQPGDILKIVTDEEFDRLVEERRKTGEARVKAGLRRTAPERVYEIDLDLGGE